MANERIQGRPHSPAKHGAESPLPNQQGIQTTPGQLPYPDGGANSDSDGPEEPCESIWRFHVLKRWALFVITFYLCVQFVTVVLAAGWALFGLPEALLPFMHLVVAVPAVIWILSLEKNASITKAFGLRIRPIQGLNEQGTPIHRSELSRDIRSFSGVLIILGSGWGVVLGCVSLLTWKLHVPILISVALGQLLTLIVFLLLERNLWLNRFSGYYISSGTTQVGEATALWLLGIIILLIRGTESRRAAHAGTAKAPQDVGASVTREIAETVVFVVVLVLLLKAFVAQAFVIPTGSMAVTLYGYQMDVTCPKCGIEFPVNASNEVDPSDGGPPTPVEACTCPNCRYRIDFRDEMRRNPKFERPSPSTGDRVLVADFLYDLPGGGPKRLDVVVFKYPGDSSREPFQGGFPVSGPQKQQSAMNYIKRLIGRPGETIGIWHGKLYYLPGDQLSPDKKAEYHRKALENIWKARIEQTPLDKHDEFQTRMEHGEEPENWEKDLWRWNNMFVEDLKDQLRDGVAFQIIRKPPAKILEMRRIVYDNDHPPEDLHGDLRNRWTAEPGAGWSTVEPHGFQSDSALAGTSWLRYRHILRTSKDRQPELITDFMGYNTYHPHRGGGEPQQNWVGDLLIECEVAVEQPSGTFTLELSKGTDRFRAAWDVASGKCTLSHLKAPHAGTQVVRLPPEDSHYVELASKPTKLHGKGKYRVRFANIDDRLLVWVDDELPFADGLNYESFTEKGPYTNDLQPASIGVQGATLQVRKLSLWRDTYYTRDPGRGADAAPKNDDWANPDDWQPLREIAPTTFYVQPGHYLCLGDNSPESSDGRSWGLVPERLLLGRALVVYYPFSRAGRIK